MKLNQVIDDLKSRDQIKAGGFIIAAISFNKVHILLPKAQRVLNDLGENIKLARLRRKLLPFR